MSHGLDWDIIRRWKKPAYGILGIHVAIIFILCEDYMHSYHMNKSIWRNYKANRTQGLVPPYRVKYSKERASEKNIEVVWDSFRYDVQ